MAPAVFGDKFPLSQILDVFLEATANDIVPLNKQRPDSKVFGAAIFKKDTLELVVAETNQANISPLVHAETGAIFEFFKIPADQRPATKDCFFYSSHEPCSLCLSGITWAGFDNHTYLFTYDDTKDTFSIPYDIDITNEVFKVPNAGESREEYLKRPMYNKTNKYWDSFSMQELVESITDAEEKKKLTDKLASTKALYDSVNEFYQATKAKENEYPFEERLKTSTA